MSKKVSIFNIDPNHVKIKDIHQYNYHDYDFLNHLKSTIKVTFYYDLLKSINSFKLNSLYQLIFFRIIKINKKFNEIDLLTRDFTITDSIKLNDILNKYINNDILKSILIINSIQQYFIPVY